MSLSAYALTSLAAIGDYIGGIPERNGIWIYSPSPAGATAATVAVSDTTLTLVITGGASAGTSTFTLAATAYDTITELVTGINALTGKWVAGAITNGAAASTDLVVTGAVSALGSANELTLKIADNYGVTELINRATDLIERYCGRRFMSRSYDRAQYVGNGREKLLLRDYPVTRVFRVSEGRTNAFYVTNTTATNFATVDVNATTLRLSADGTVTSLTLSSYTTINLLIAAINATSGWTATLIGEGTRSAYYTGSDGSTKVAELVPMPAARCKSPDVAYVEVWDEELDDYHILGGAVDNERDSGTLVRPGGWIAGETYAVDSVAGYATAPAALEEACLMLVKYAKDKMSKDAGLASETLGDYAWSAASIKAALPDDIRGELSSFRSFEF